MTLKRRWRTGVVKRIDRANRVLYADVDGATDIECLYLAGDPRDPHCRTPWPLGLAWFDLDRGTPLCMGPVGGRRVLFHDDFTHVSSPNGDTPWSLTDGTAPATMAAQAGSRVGVARIGDAIFEKDTDALIVPSPPEGLYASIGVSLVDTTAFTVGFYDSIPSGSALIQAHPLASFPTFQLVGSDDDLDDGTLAEYGEWYHLELLIVGGLAAMWVDGNGPSLSTEGFLSSGTAVTFGFIFEAGEGDLDFASVSRVTVAQAVGSAQ